MSRAHESHIASLRRAAGPGRPPLSRLAVLVVHRRALREVAPLAGGRLLDIGCGTKPHADLFAPYVDEHVGVDHAETPHGTAAADLIAPAYEIPVPNGSFDTVLSTAVLEHLERPADALAEARRVLRDGGVAIYTAPFIWEVHEAPRDFYRYSPFGLRYLFEGAGFEIEQIRPLSGYWLTAGQLFVSYLHRLNRGPLRILRVIPMIGLAVQAASLALDRVDRSAGAADWAWMHLVVARAAPASAGRAR